MHTPELYPVTLKKDTVRSFETLEQTFTMRHENPKNNHHLDSCHENLGTYSRCGASWLL
jgi:hypothetical protein